MEWMKRPFGKEMEESDGGDGQKGEYLKEIEKQSKGVSYEDAVIFVVQDLKRLWIKRIR